MSEFYGDGNDYCNSNFNSNNKNDVNGYDISNHFKLDNKENTNKVGRFTITPLNNKFSSLNEKISDKPITNDEVSRKLRVYKADEYVIQKEPSENDLEFFKKQRNKTTHINPITNDEVSRKLRVYKADEYVIIIQPEGEKLEKLKNELEPKFVNWRVIKRNENRAKITKYLAKYATDELINIKELEGEALEQVLQQLKGENVVVMPLYEIDNSINKLTNDELVHIKELEGEELEAVLQKLKSKKVCELTDEDNQKYSSKADYSYNILTNDFNAGELDFEEIEPLTESSLNTLTANSAAISLG
jgi:hypothetical protein